MACDKPGDHKVIKNLTESPTSWIGESHTQLYKCFHSFGEFADDRFIYFSFIEKKVMKESIKFCCKNAIFAEAESLNVFIR